MIGLHGIPENTIANLPLGHSGGYIAELEITRVPNFETFVPRATELSALSAKIIEPRSIVTAPWVRLKCQFGLGRYGKSHCCPPKTPTPIEMQSVIDCCISLG